MDDETQICVNEGVDHKRPKIHGRHFNVVLDAAIGHGQGQRGQVLPLLAFTGGAPRDLQVFLAQPRIMSHLRQRHSLQFAMSLPLLRHCLF